MNSTLRIAICLVLPAAWCGPLIADDAEDSSAERQSRVAAIRGLVEMLQPTLLHDKAELKPDLLGSPALLYADGGRDLTRSSLWIWEQAGLPVAVTAVEWHAGGENQGRWTFEFASLCADRIKIALPKGGTWTASEAGRPDPIAGAPAVAGSRPQRLVQMKQLAERFSAIEQHPTEGRLELRRLPAPIYRQAEGGDSAMFVFANGTNPEVVLLIAAFHDEEREQKWGFRSAALSSTELTLSCDDRVVWNESRFSSKGTRGRYTNGLLKVETENRTDSPPPK